MILRMPTLAIALLGIAFPGAVQPQDSAARPVRSSAYEGTASCNLNRVMIGPDGTGVAAWLNDRAYLLGPDRLPTIFIVAGRMNEPDQAEKDRLFGVEGGGQRLLPIRWTPDGRLLVRVHERDQRAVSIDPDRGAVAEAGSLDPAWSRVHLFARSHGGLDALRDAKLVAAVTKIDGKTFIRGTATLGKATELLAVRYPSLQLARFTGRGFTDLPLNAAETRMLVALSPNEGDASYLGSPLRRQGSYRPHQQPIFDLATGRLAGSFGADRVDLSGVPSLAARSRLLNAALARSGSVILDASLSGEAMIALTLSSNGDRKLIRLSRRSIAERPLCAPLPAEMIRARAKPPYPLSAPPGGPVPAVRIFSLASNGRETASPGNPVAVQYRLGKGPGRDLVLYFHGGPGGTLADGYFPVPVDRLLTPRRDVVSVEYSGSIGGGLKLSRGLARHGMKSLERDLDALFRWARLKRYARIYVLGSSFGGIPALLAIKRHRDSVAASFLVAPALRLQDPSAWASQGSGLAPVGANTQLAYEETYLGGPRGRRRFANEMEELVRTAPLGAQDHFYFAELDPMSRPEHLPPGPSPRTIMPKTVHAASLAQEDLWKDIISELE